MSQPIIQIQHLNKTFGTGPTAVHALEDINLEIEAGEIFGIIGLSGAGKSTLVRCMNLLERPTTGSVLVDGKDLTKLRDKQLRQARQDISMIFQSFNLLMQRTALDNICFPLELIGTKRADAVKRARELLELVGLGNRADAYPAQLSGGQKQRVAIARALVARPQVLLLDEPLGALDLKLRKDMQVELKKIQKQTGITFVFVTHDQEEALSMSDTVVVMSEGKIHQIGTPIDIYNEPQNAFVADFIGESNILDGTMLEDYKVSFSGQTFPCLDKDFGRNVPVDVVVRPEDVDIVPLEQGQLTGVVTSVTFMGVHYEIIVDVGGFKWMVQTTDFVDVDEHIGIVLEPDAIHIMKKSEYSNRYGDYSSFSNELEELSEIAEEEAE